MSSDNRKYTCSLEAKRCIPDATGNFLSLEECRKYCWTSSFPPNISKVILDYIPDHAINTDIPPKSQLQRLLKGYYHPISNEDAASVLKIMSDPILESYNDEVFRIRILKDDQPDVLVFSEGRREPVMKYYQLLKFPALYDYYFNNFLAESEDWDGTLYDYEIEEILSNGSIDSIESIYRYSPFGLEKAFGMSLEPVNSGDLLDQYPFTYSPLYPHLVNLHTRYYYENPRFIELLQQDNYFQTFARHCFHFHVWILSKVAYGCDSYIPLLAKVVSEKGMEWTSYVLLSFAFGNHNLRDDNSLNLLRSEVEKRFIVIRKYESIRSKIRRFENILPESIIFKSYLNSF